MSFLSVIGAITVAALALAVAIVVLFWIIRGLATAGRAFTRIPDHFWMPESSARRENAVAILTARRVGAISLPFSTVLVWRSNVRWGRDKAARAVGMTLAQVLSKTDFEDDETRAVDRAVRRKGRRSTWWAR